METDPMFENPAPIPWLGSRRGSLPISSVAKMIDVRLQTWGTTIPSITPN